MLAVAVVAVSGAIAVLACAPAAPARQAGDSGDVVAKEKPTPTPTLHPDCVTLTFPDGGKGTSCPPLGPENVDANLRRHYNGHIRQGDSRAG